MRRVPAVVWWITALFVATMVAYSILLPTYRAPDEPQHVSLVHRYADGLGYPAWDEGAIDAGVLASMRQVRFVDRSRHLTAGEAPDPEQRASIEEFAGADPPRQINQVAQHPFLYYVATGTALEALERVAGDPIGGYHVEVWLLRLFNIAFLAPLPLIIWRAGTLLRMPPTLIVAACLFPVVNPQLTHLGASVNNDTLLVLLFSCLAPVVIRLGDGEVRTRTAALAGVITGAALLVKGFALLMPVWIGAALLLAFLRNGRRAMPAVVRAGLVSAGVTMALGGWWWVRNLVRFGELSPSRFSQLVPDRPDFQPDYSEFLQRWGDRSVRRFWGWFGWFDTSIPRAVPYLATLACLVAVAVALRRRDPSGVPLATRWLLLIPLPLLVLNQLLRALVSYRRTGGSAGLQGRYWFGALVPLSVLVVLGAAAALPRARRWLPATLLAVGVVLHGLSASTILGYYWGPSGAPLDDRLRAVIAWAPVSGTVIVIGAALGLAALAQTVRLVVRAGEPTVRRP